MRITKRQSPKKIMIILIQRHQFNEFLRNYNKFELLQIYQIHKKVDAILLQMIQ